MVSNIVNWLYEIYFYMIIIYVLLSWLPNARESVIGQFLAKMVEPYLSFFRRFIPPIMGVVDISPIVALVVLQLARQGLLAVLGYILS